MRTGMRWVAVGRRSRGLCSPSRRGRAATGWDS